MMPLLDLGLALVGAPVLAASLYLLLLTALSFSTLPRRHGESRQRFQIVVPAHDEALGITSTVESLLALDYPRELFEVVVVADNCTDDTAERAQAAGARVLVRHDEQARGKGYALHHAFQQLPTGVDAAVVIDADTLASPNLLRAFAARLEAGALAVQADYAVRNPNAGWRTRLIAIAFGAFHIVRSRGRERLGVSVGLRGNGMCFATRLLAEVPHQAFSIVEDVEYGIRIGEAGHRVHYADEAHVYGEMVTSAAASRSQRTRWEGGRAALLRTYGPRLIRAAMAGRDPVLADLAMDVLVPPLSRLAVAAGVGLLMALGASLAWAHLSVSLTLYATSILALVTYVLRGWSLSGTGARGLVDLALAPVYVAWKLTLRRSAPRGADPGAPEWVRTTRERGEP